MYNPQLDVFIKVADSGSFSKAAEAMYISAPAIIQQINLLEASYGFKLFIRSNHRVRLTPAGRSLYEDAFEGIYGSAGWDGLCQFLELDRTPICCAVAKNHRLADMRKLTMQDLNGEYLVMPIEGVSKESDVSPIDF